MGTTIRMQFTNDNATPEDWDKLVSYLEANYQVSVPDDGEYVEVIINASYSHCGEFPNFEGFPQVKGVSWDKWYEERDSDECGTLGDDEE